MLEGRCDTDTQLKYLAKTHAHTHLFVTLLMWQAKAPAGETHSAFYSLRTRDCGGKERKKGGESGKRGRSKKGEQVEPLIFRDVQLSLKYRPK